MKCPIDQTELSMTDRQGIEIDFCPKCRGVWLDRGELDKIIERSATAQEAQPLRHESPPQERYSEEPRYEYKKRKKESFLGDLFDF